MEMLLDSDFWEFFFFPVFMMGVLPWLPSVYWWLSQNKVDQMNHRKKD